MALRIALARRRFHCFHRRVLFQRIFEGKLAQASFLVGCTRTGQALVVDPTRAVDQYIQAAEAAGVRITHVTESHIHADFVSGSRDLAARTGARLLLPARGDYGFPGTPLAGGDTFALGDLRVNVLDTPGHTPEHLTFLLTDITSGDRPWAALTGDFLFVGNVGRPDLLERAARIPGAAVVGAEALHASLQRFRALPCDLQIWPGHGAGSACGKALSAAPSATLRAEIVGNWAFQLGNVATFTAEVLAGQPEPPRYFAVMKRVNREGLPPLAALPNPPAFDRAPAGAVTIDIRATSGLVPGSLKIPLSNAFPTRAGSVVPYDADIALLAADAATAREAARDLSLIGLDRVVGWLAPGGAEIPMPSIDINALAVMLRAGSVTLINVRDPAEWQAGHIEGAIHLPLATLADHIAEIPTGRPVAVHCQGGARSVTAASVLSAHGVRDVRNVAGGFAAWQGAGKRVRRDDRD